jgi:hypothetical protein
MTAMDLDRIDPKKLKIGSADWVALNASRADLIRQKNRNGISESEREEFDRLQRLVRAALDESYPLPSVDTARLDQIEERLRWVEQQKAG